MLSVIGTRTVLLIILLALFSAGSYYYINHIADPGIRKYQIELRRNQSDIKDMREEMEKLEVGVEKFKAEKTRYEQIEQLGFFDDQNRLKTKQRFTVLENESDLVSFQYNIRAGQDEANELAAEAGYKIIVSDIDILAGAIDDRAIYKFVYMLNYGFPGHLSIKEFELSKTVEITEPVLRNIGTSETVPLVNATIKATLRTMVPDPEAAEENEKRRRRR